MEDTKLTPAQFKGKYHYGTGRRKSAAARVRLYPGSGQFVINDKPAPVYLNPKGLESMIIEPLVAVGMSGKFDISARVAGGGPKGQAEAIRHGIARALLDVDENLRTTLKAHKFLTRDPRVKERKKYGLKRARRAPQFAKR